MKCNVYILFYNVINAQYGYGALVIASKEGHLAVTKKLVGMGLSVNESLKVLERACVMSQCHHFCSFSLALLHFISRVSRDTPKLLNIYFQLELIQKPKIKYNFLFR